MKWRANWYGKPEPCTFCSLNVEPEEGVVLELDGGSAPFLFHERCLRTLADAATSERVDMVEVDGVWYTPEEKPAPPPISPTKTKDPRVVYHEPVPEEPPEPLKYRPVIPPRPRR